MRPSRGNPADRASGVDRQCLSLGLGRAASSGPRNQRGATDHGSRRTSGSDPHFHSAALTNDPWDISPPWVSLSIAWFFAVSWMISRHMFTRDLCLRLQPRNGALSKDSRTTKRDGSSVEIFRLMAKFIQQRLCFPQIGVVEAFGELAVEFGEHRSRLIATSVLVEQTRQALTRAQLK